MFMLSSSDASAVVGPILIAGCALADLKSIGGLPRKAYF
jgi:hypothetical protein